MADIHVLFKFAPNPYGGIEIDTTSSSGIYRELSPFILRVPHFGGKVIFENLWQFSKVYKQDINPHTGIPQTSWYQWHEAGVSSNRPIRYPMGKGAIPEYSWWYQDGEGYQKLDYIQARKRIYAPIYAKYVRKTDSFKCLKQLYLDSAVIVLRDYDAYDHLKLGMTLVDVINNPDKKMGHAFVLAMMLTGVLDRCLER